MKSLLLVLAFFFNTYVYSQHDDTTYIFAASTVLLTTPNSSGSGVIYRDLNNSRYLITANHVLFETNGQISSPVLSIIYYSGNPNYSLRDTLNIDLKEALRERFLIGDSLNDIAILKLSTTDSITTLLTESFVSWTGVLRRMPRPFSFYQQTGIHEVEPTSDIFMLGYPKSLDFGNNYDFNKPLIRKGIISGVDIKNNKIIIDCASFWGNSGGPIIQFDS